MKKYTIVTTSGLAISIIAEEFERNQQLGRLAFRIGDSNAFRLQQKIDGKG